MKLNRRLHIRNRSLTRRQAACGRSSRVPAAPVLATGAALALAACAAAPREITRAEIARTAESYRWHRWTPSAKNILHGPDRDGIHVDTPDHTWRPGRPGAGWWIPGTETEGIPYKWGGFDTIRSFERGLRRGLAAGDVYSDAKRAALAGAVSRRAVGVDCSGFVSRCWGLKRHYSTRELPMLCDPVRWEDLQTGDILNSHNNHVVLFARWLDPAREWMLVWQAGTETSHKVAASRVRAAGLAGLGYQPLRYRRVAER